jgi:hypothetical protein
MSKVTMSTPRVATKASLMMVLGFLVMVKKKSLRWRLLSFAVSAS